MNKLLTCELCSEQNNQTPRLVCGHYICCICYTKSRNESIHKCPFCNTKLRRKQTKSNK